MGIELTGQWTQLRGNYGTWLYMRESAVYGERTDDINDEEGNYPDIEVVEILFLPEYMASGEITEPYPYIATEAYTDVQHVSYKDMLDYTRYRGLAKTTWGMAPEEIPWADDLLLIMNGKDGVGLTDADRLFFSERIKWIRWNQADKTPDGYTRASLADTLWAVCAWRLLDACGRAEAIFGYRGGDPVGYGRGEFASFEEACNAAGIARYEAEDESEWELGEDNIEPYGPECEECGNPIYPVSRHNTDHWNEMQERAEWDAMRLREQLAEQAMNERFEGD